MNQVFVVTRVQGAGWDAARPLTKQDDWPAHAALMDQMFAAGFVLFAGPIEGGPSFEAMMIVRANDEAEVRARFAGDPWVVKDISRIVRVVSWNIRLGTLPDTRS